MYQTQLYKFNFFGLFFLFILFFTFYLYFFPISNKINDFFYQYCKSKDYVLNKDPSLARFLYKYKILEHNQNYQDLIHQCNQLILYYNNIKYRP